jgi:hypothetical protein
MFYEMKVTPIANDGCYRLKEGVNTFIFLYFEFEFRKDLYYPQGLKYTYQVCNQVLIFWSEHPHNLAKVVVQSVSSSHCFGQGGSAAHNWPLGPNGYIYSLVWPLTVWFSSPTAQFDRKQIRALFSLLYCCPFKLPSIPLIFTIKTREKRHQNSIGKKIHWFPKFENTWFTFGRRSWVLYSWSFAPSQLGVALELANLCGSLGMFVKLCWS